MRIELKSLAYFFVANDFEVYINEKNEETIYVSQLVCTECLSPWYMELQECLLCGMVHPYIKKCPSCGKIVSTTNTRSKCNECDEEFIYPCLNDKCPSNQEGNIRSATLYTNSYSRKKGVFARNSVFSTSMNFCLNCGNESNRYITREVFLETIDDEIDTNLQKSQLTKYNQEAINRGDSLLIIKDDTGEYSANRGHELSDEETLELNEFKEKIDIEKFYD